MFLRIYYYTNCPNLNYTRQKIGQRTPEIVRAHKHTGDLLEKCHIMQTGLNTLFFKTHHRFVGMQDTLDSRLNFTNCIRLQQITRMIIGF